MIKVNKDKGYGLKTPNLSNFVKWVDKNQLKDILINIIYKDKGEEEDYVGPLYDLKLQGNTLYLKVEDNQFIKVQNKDIKSLSAWTKSNQTEVYFGETTYSTFAEGGAGAGAGSEVGKDEVKNASLEGVNKVKDKLKSILEVKVGDKIAEGEKDFKIVKKVTKTTRDGKKGVEVEFESSKDKKKTTRFYAEGAKVQMFSEGQSLSSSEETTFAAITSFVGEIAKILVKMIPEDMIKDIPAGRLSSEIYKEVTKRQQTSEQGFSQKDMGLSLNLPKEEFFSDFGKAVQPVDTTAEIILKVFGKFGKMMMSAMFPSFKWSNPMELVIPAREYHYVIKELKGCPCQYKLFNKGKVVAFNFASEEV